MQYFFCAHCGARLEQGVAFAPQRCARCHTWHYHNSKPCACALVMQNGRVLLARRAVEPRKGFWDVPGGFLEAGEHPEDGARRELLEETGLTIRLTGLLGIYMDSYGAGGAPMIIMYYLAETTGGVLRAMDDVAALEWRALDDLPNEFAFEHQLQVMKDLKKSSESYQADSQATTSR